MDRNFVEATIAKHNQVIDDFITIELPERLKELGFKDVNGKFPLNAWFAANGIVSEQGFYSRACAVLEILRHEGFDVKRDAQSNHLVWYGGMI